MKAMILNKIHDLTKEDQPLKLKEIPRPEPSGNEILLRVEACGVCHTELDEIEGRTPPPRFPVIPGHEVVGVVESKGAEADRFQIGERVGAGWIFSSCGSCVYCKSGRENLCSGFRATGRDADGGYAEFMRIDEKYAVKIPGDLDPVETAPLLCAGGVGYRSLKLTGLENGQNLGLTGFGASGHLVLLLVRSLFPDSEVHVFARSSREREFALELGAVWSGRTEDNAPLKLDAVIDTTPAWKPVVEALKNLSPGGRLVINAIRKENKDIDYLTNLSYHKHLWLEKEIKSVANVTRNDIAEFLAHASAADIKPTVSIYSLEDANKALLELKKGVIKGAKVLKIS